MPGLGSGNTGSLTRQIVLWRYSSGLTTDTNRCRLQRMARSSPAFYLSSGLRGRRCSRVFKEQAYRLLRLRPPSSQPLSQHAGRGAFHAARGEESEMRAVPYASGTTSGTTIFRSSFLPSVTLIKATDFDGIRLPGS